MGFKYKDIRGSENKDVRQFKTDDIIGLVTPFIHTHFLFLFLRAANLAFAHTGPLTHSNDYLELGDPSSSASDGMTSL